MAPVALADVIANRTSVSLARSQRLVSSWLPPPSHESLRQQKAAEQNEEDARIFAPEPELLGLGSSPPKNGETMGSNGTVNSQDAQLRQRLLGKRKRDDRSRVNGQFQNAVSARPPRTASNQLQGTDEDDEDEPGRSALGKPRSVPAQERQFPERERRNNTEENGMGEEDENANGKRSDEAAKARRSNQFLDDVLAEKARKRAQKRKRKRDKKKDEARTAREGAGSELG